MDKQGYVYILTNWNKTVLYVGVTSNIVKRIWEHKEKLVDGFTKRYNCKILLYYEVLDDIEEAIKREKQIKGWTRKRKEDLIKTKNPELKDLYDEIL
ncbi:MAG: GIY-YIG nuclease family protein [Deferribacterales bacterium]|jgi:putative endonuclease